MPWHGMRSSESIGRSALSGCSLLASTSSVLVALALTPLLLCVTSTDAAARQINPALSGRVVDQDRLPISSADVRVEGRSGATTDANGFFRFDNIPAGPVQLFVTALGYEDFSLTFELRSDTALYIQLLPSAIVLDPVEAATRRVTVSGRVIDAGTRLGTRAMVFLRPGTAADETDLTGRYRIRNAPAGPGSRVMVESFGYLPQVVELLSDRDTAIDFRLEPDPVAQAMINHQVQRLRDRGEALRLDVEGIERGPAFMSGTVWNVLRQNYHIRGAYSYFLDEECLRYPQRVLNSTPAHEVSYIEIIDRKGWSPMTAEMVRIYTRGFVRDMVLRHQDVGDLFVSRGLRPPGCW
jgi:hypothetical protein